MRVGALQAALLLTLAACGAGKPPPTQPMATAEPVPTPPRPRPVPLARDDAGLPHLTKDEICALPRGAVADALPTAKPFTRADPPWRETDDPFVARALHAPPGDSCFVADENLARAERELRAAGPGAPVAPVAPATKTAPVRYLDRIDAHLHLNEAELALLHENGFVALDRLERESYATAYHEIFQQELPVYVSIDSVLNSVFQSNGVILQHIEEQDLYPRLVRLLTRVRGKLQGSASLYGDETAADLDVYLGVAEGLLGDAFSPAGPPPKPAPVSLFHHDDEVTDLVGRGTAEDAALSRVTLFGRARMVDFSQLTPRGHYAGGGGYSNSVPPLDRYFRAMTWLSRLEWNLVSRSCRSSAADEVEPQETPREERDAMALADLVSRSGELDDLRAFDRVYTVFAGPREDVSVPDLLRLMATAHVTPASKDAPERLRAAIGTGFARTARVHFMPDRSTTLPVIATLFGPRIVPDTAPLTRLVHSAVSGRMRITAADVAFTLGHDRALSYLTGDLATHPELRSALDGARGELRKGLAGKTDLYSKWISAVVHLADAADPRAGALPSFMRTDAYRDLSMNSAVVGYGQIRHNYVLVAAQGYDSYGCEIPDGYVEPALGTYDALLAYARAAKAADAKASAYWTRVVDVLGTLRAIVKTELSGAPLSEAQRRWLGMITEYIPTGGYGDSGAPPKWTGWYFDLFPDRHFSAERSPAFIADYFTLTNAGEVAYVGADRPRVGVFVVDVNGQPRAMVGPVAKGYELWSPIASRLDDKKGRTVAGKTAPWLASYLAPEVELPDLHPDSAVCPGDEERVVLRPGTPVGDVTVTLLDHHGDPLTPPLTSSVDAGPTVFTFRLNHALAKAPYGVEGMHAWVHDLSVSGVGHGRGDVTSGVRVYSSLGDYFDPDLPPLHHPFEGFGAPRGFGPMPGPAE